MGRGSGQGSDGGGVVALSSAHVSGGIHKESGISMTPHIDKQTASFLQKYPLQNVWFSKVLPNNNPYGLYWHSKSSIAIRGNIPKGTPSLTPYRKGGILGPDVWTTTTAAKSARIAQRATLTHEIGHHAHQNISIRSSMEVSKMYRERVASGNFITRYARENVQEFFAESYAAYKHYGKDLKAADRELYDAMRRYTKELSK